MPKRIVDRWNGIVASFWCNNAKESKYIAWLDRRKLQKMKDEGGLGLKKFQMLNLALIIKQAWRIIVNPDLLISKIYKAKYASSDEMMDAQIGSRPSWAWRSIYWGLSTLKNWMMKRNGVSVEYDFLRGDGEFSTRAAYKILLAEENKREAEVYGESSDKKKVKLFWKRFWRIKVQNKAKVFMWRLFHNAVPVAANLIRRGCRVDSNCVVCGARWEDSIHVFLNCRWAKEFWNSLLNMPEFLNLSFTTLGDWIWYCLQEMQSEELSKNFCGARWIWWNRNQLYHSKEGVDLNTAVLKVRRAVTELSQAGFRFVVSKPEPGDRWVPPETGYFKISCDGAWNPLSKRAGIGVECRNS
ncbi:hypothetical protein QQ045_015436 [Rhodiola kirilowii]